MFKKILCLYDLSKPSENALEWALRFGEQFHADLEVLHILPWTEHLVGHDFLGIFSEVAPKIQQDIDRKLRVLGGKKTDGVLERLRIKVLGGLPIPTILRAISRGAPDLVIAGSHGHRGLTHLLLGSVAEKLVRHSPAPVLVAKSAPPWPLRTVLAPIDVIEPVEESFLLAEALLQSIPLQAKFLHVLPVSEILGSYRGSGAPSNFLETESIRRKVTDQLNEIVRKKFSAEAQVQVTEGNVATEICRYAEETRTDLVLMPTHGRQGWDRFLMGSVAERVVREAHCSVLSFCPGKAAELRGQWLQELQEPPGVRELGISD